MISDDKFSCPPQYHDWEGYHAVPLKCYDEETATQKLQGPQSAEPGK